MALHVQCVCSSQCLQDLISHGALPRFWLVLHACSSNHPGPLPPTSTPTSQWLLLVVDHTNTAVNSLHQIELSMMYGPSLGSCLQACWTAHKWLCLYAGASPLLVGPLDPPPPHPPVPSSLSGFPFWSASSPCECLLPACLAPPCSACTRQLGSRQQKPSN